MVVSRKRPALVLGNNRELPSENRLLMMHLRKKARIGDSSLLVESGPRPTVEDSDEPQSFEGTLTDNVMLSWIIVIAGALLIGYDMGLLGSISYAPGFLWDLFLSDSSKMVHATESNHCHFVSRPIVLLTSLSYIVSLVTNIFTLRMCSIWGRKWVLLLGSIINILAVLLTTIKLKAVTAILWRILNGIGVGVCCQVVPGFLIELPHTKAMETMKTMFTITNAIGICMANAMSINLNEKVPSNGWHILLGLEALPMAILLVCAYLVSDTPHSLVRRGKWDKAGEVLRRTRGRMDVSRELAHIVADQQMGRFKKFFHPSNRPILIIIAVVWILQNFTGTAVLMFYAPVFLSSFGLKKSISKYSSCIFPAASLIGKLLAPYVSKVFGRRRLLLTSYVLTIFSLCIIGTFVDKLKDYNTLGHNEAIAVLVFSFVFMISFSFQSLLVECLEELLPEGLSEVKYVFLVSVDMVLRFSWPHGFLVLICKVKALLFFMHAILVVLEMLFFILIVPRVEDVPPNQELESVLLNHWFWKRFVHRSRILEITA